MTNRKEVDPTLFKNADIIASCPGYRWRLQSFAFLVFTQENDLAVLEENFNQKVVYRIYQGKNLAQACDSFWDLLESWKHDKIKPEWRKQETRPYFNRLIPILSNIIQDRDRVKSVGIMLTKEEIKDVP